MAGTEPGISILPVVMAGGHGTRLEPISTSERPKPFVPLPDGKSLLTRTLERVANSALFAPPVLIGQYAQRYALLNHARDAGCANPTILLEPRANNTAFAIASIVAYLLPRQPNSCIAILPADQAIEDTKKWQETIRSAADLASKNQKLCLLGIEPTRSEPNFGHLLLGKPIGEGFEVAHFVEKPNQPLELGPALWNAGQFIAPVSVLAELLETHITTMWAHAQRAVAHAKREWEFLRLDAAEYGTHDYASFDRLVLEKISPLAIPFQGVWRDLGTVSDWESYTNEKAEKWARLKPRVDRPWGYYELLGQTAQRTEKRLVLYPGCRISLQRHHHRAEQWTILQGEAEITLDGKVEQRNSGQITIEAYTWHRLANNANINLIIHEVQYGNPSEEDIERRDDDYERLIYSE